ncbi:MAG: hypothetical protein AVDCRST_MAG73-1220, partial [uncultured Thermomicrobiales bacterium]
ARPPRPWRAVGRVERAVGRVVGRLPVHLARTTPAAPRPGWVRGDGPCRALVARTPGPGL